MPDEAPTFRPHGRVLTRAPSQARAAGRWGRSDERGGVCYATQRDSHTHRLRALNAYAISTDVLECLRALGVGRVFVVETDSHDVYEYELADFMEYGNPVPDKYLETPADPQRYHSRDDPIERWTDHLDDFYVHAEPPRHDPGFQPASEYET